MSKCESKEALLEAIRTARTQLEKKFAGLTPEQMTWPGSMDDWSVKDILAHLVDWEQRFIGWYQAGLGGEVPATPAPGMTWRDLPKLNQQGYEKRLNDPLEDVLADFESSYRRILELIEGMPEAEMFSPGHYAWTGKSPLVQWIAANTCSHYNWARNQIRTSKIRKAFVA